MRTKARTLFWIGLLCFVPLFFPTFRNLKISHGTDKKLTLGLPSTPWLVGNWIETEEEVRQGTLTSYSGN